ncbi:hypothetical protein MMC14_001441 [Varicellaria rhodocarpa]|nr:hypothetical protein [Varicellaria rhodocarpa]
MASLLVASSLATLDDANAPQQSKSPGYLELLNQTITTPDSPTLSSDLKAFIDSILGGSLGIVAARPLLGAYVQSLGTLGSAKIKIEVGQYALQALQARVVSFEEQDACLRDIVADAYQQQEDYVDAAKVLQGIQLESSQRKINDEEKVRTWIRICRLYLEEDDTTSAESYLNRAKNLLYKVDDKDLNLYFQLSQARIFDARRKFLEASQVYHGVSLSMFVAEEERAHTLSSAIICAVLAPAGPQRSRVLGKLFRDERSLQLEEFGILEKMLLNRLISPREVTKFADKLQPHQVAQTADGSTVLAKAVIEHNLLGASRLYDNIGVEELGNLLALNADKAEEYAARMLEQGRLSGRIDQIRGVIYFDAREGTTGRKNVSSVHHNNASSLRKWDRNVEGLTGDVERVTSLLQSRFSVISFLPVSALAAHGF